MRTPKMILLVISMLLIVAIVFVSLNRQTNTAPVGTEPRGGREYLLSDPFLQLPTDDTVRVVWFTEFAGEGHTLTYGSRLDQKARATSYKMTRMYEDQNSERGETTYSEVTERDVWRHEAIAQNLAPGVRTPYYVTSINDDGVAIHSRAFTLQPLPAPGQHMQILLTSDQQNRQMSPANFQKLLETVGIVDVVFFAGDMVDNPHRASEWFDRYNPEWLTGNNPTSADFDATRPAFDTTRPAFFPALQGHYHTVFPEFPYTGGAILQHAPLFGIIGNHEAPGRWRPNDTFLLNETEQTATINFMDNDPQPRWYAEIRYEQQQEQINPTRDPAIREQWIRDNSFEFTQYFEVWTHPEGPLDESYYAYRIGDVFLIAMNVSRVWRTWNITPDDRSKFTELTNELSNPDNWGFGDMWFETFGKNSDQYRWLEGVLQSEAFQGAKYRVVMGHQTMFGLGDNSVPVMADPIATITYTNGAQEQTKQVVWPLTRAEWEAEIEPILSSITNIRYEYPLAGDVWKNDIHPLLLGHGVDLVFTGHSHLWNRTQIDGIHYLETSNVGNTFGAYFADEQDVVNERASWASAFWDELATDSSGWNPKDYARFNDPHGHAPMYPTHGNPMREMDDAERDLPYVASNNITVFTVFDTKTGMVSSYAFDTRQPDSEVRLFDQFSLAE